MKYDPPYWFWDSNIPISVCNSIIEYGKSFESEQATVGYGEQGRIDPNIRKSKVFFFEDIHWINGITNQYCALANTSAWNFEISGQQSPQFTVYRPGEFYDFHSDESNHAVRVRLAVQLTTGAHYRDALEHLLVVLRADRDWNNGEAKRLYLDTIASIGKGDPLAAEYQRKLFSILY